jgi:hypothetical protein
MRHTLTAIIVTSVVSGALLLAAILTLEGWHRQRYSDAQALQSPLSDADAVVVDNPYQIEESPMAYVPIFIAFCAASTFWVVFVVIPSLLASRRLFAGSLASHTVAAVVVSVLSGITFALLQGVRDYISPIVTFGAGGVIGLVSIVLVVRMLPPNKSLERTHER